MIGFNNQFIKLLQYNAPIPLYDRKYALHITLSPTAPIGRQKDTKHFSLPWLKHVKRCEQNILVIPEFTKGWDPLHNCHIRLTRDYKNTTPNSNRESFQGKEIDLWNNSPKYFLNCTMRHRRSYLFLADDSRMICSRLHILQRCYDNCWRRHQHGTPPTKRVSK